MGEARQRASLRSRLQVEFLEGRVVPAFTVQFGLPSESLLETAGTFTIPVALSTASNTDITVPFTMGGNAISGTDFSGVTASPLVIPAGQFVGNITGTLLDDGAPDAIKTLTLTLGAPNNGYTLGAVTTNTMTIAEPAANPTTLSIANSSAIEPGRNGVTNMVFTVTRSGDLTSQITVGFTTVPGTAQPKPPAAVADFTPTTGTTIFASGAATATINIPIFGNGVYNNPSLTFSVQLTGVVNVVGPPVTFAAQQPFAAGMNPVSVAVGDVNGDGESDLIVANDSAATVSVLLNTTAPGAATPSFATQQTFATGTQPISVALRDVNGDGRPDLIVANFSDATVSVLLNTTAPGAATPSFAPQQTFATGSGPHAVALGDVNGDGKPDLIVANVGASTVSVLLNTTAPGAATPSFAPQQTFAAGTQPICVACADVNGDGKADVVVANFDANTVSVLLNTTTPGATTAAFAARQTFATGINPVSVAVGDVNGDGKPDLLVANFSANTVSVLLNRTTPGSATPFFDAYSFATGAQPSAVALGDVNDDGKPDLLVTNSQDGTVSVLVNTATPGAQPPSFAAQQTFATGSGSFAAALADLNGDGKPDFVVADHGAGAVSVLLNTTLLGAGTITPAFPQAATQAAGNPAVFVAMGDVNGDGKPDQIVVSENDNAVLVMLNTTSPGSSTPSFATQQTFATGLGPLTVAVGDVNGDGKLDLIVANWGEIGTPVRGTTVSVLLNTTTPGATTASFAAQQTFVTGASPFSVALGDVNGDGKPDLLVTNQSDNTVSVLLNTTTPGTATASFASQQTFATGTLPRFVRSGDLNGDGRPDLLVANEDSATVSVLLNTTAPGASMASFAAQQAFPTQGNPYSAVLGDVNGDGKPDILVGSAATTTVSVLLNTTAPGASIPTFASQQTFVTGTEPISLALGDVNGDGKPDLLVAKFTDGTVSVLRNTTTPGASTVSFGPQQTFTTGYGTKSIALADINGDGKPDVAVANQSDNTASVLLNTPVTILGNLATGTITESGPPLPPPFTDSFTQANGSNLSSFWTNQLGVFHVQANQAHGDASEDLATVNVVSLLNVVVQADVTLPAGGNEQAGLVARDSGSGEGNLYWGSLIRFNGTTYANIYRHTAPSTWEGLAVLPINGNPLSGKLRFEVIDNSLQLFLNGALIASAVDAHPLLAAGSAGLLSLANTQFDNFSAKAVFTDTFSQTNNSSLNSDAWTVQSGAFTVQNNVAVSGPGYNLATLNGLSETDIHLEAAVTLAANGYIGLVARYTGVDYYWAALIDNGATTYAGILRHSASGYALLSAAVVPGGPKAASLRFEVAGNPLALFVNGNLATSVSDGALITGSAGMFSIGGGSFDNFREIPRA